MGIILVILYSIIGSLGMVLIRLGGITSNVLIEQLNVRFNISILLLIGILVYFISFFLWMIILQKFNLTFISPIAYGLTFLFTSLFSYFLLGEVIIGIQYIGVILIIIGVVIISVFKKS
ncbi:EamA family transporter [Clostridium butyricum]|uniref:EamA family transporter n=1 Tax=Clostridium butyricum TaxID=1492 RepID=UPI0018AA547F|nr:EamA family transporter [Clostridium butyricum]